MRVYNPKVESWIKEFPFLRRLQRVRADVDISVRRIDEKLLSEACLSRGSEGDVMRNKRIYFLRRSDNELVAEVGQNTYPRIWWNPGTWLWPHRFETVYECYQRLQIGDTADLIVSVDMKVLIYKTPRDHTANPPRNFTLSEWIATVRSSNDKSVQAQLEAADNLAA